jgi:peptidoglycan hydrolase-like protein with peptidoglycan-binding domain
MSLGTQHLSFGAHGGEVASLHDDLRRLGAEIAGGETDTGTFGRTTEQAVRSFQERHQLEPTGVVDERTAVRIRAEIDALDATGRSFVVHGRIGGDGVGLDVTVQAVDRDLRSEQQLGELTVSDGYYVIRYDADQFAHAEKGHADLVVIARGADGRELARSDVVYNAGVVQRIDLPVNGEARRGASEFELLVRELTPLLEGLALADLVESDEHEDVTFLAGETGRDPLRLAHLIAAHKLARRTDIAPEVFYALFRERLPVELRALVAESPGVLERAIVRAAAAQIVPAHFGTDARAHVDAIRDFSVRLLLEQPASGGRAAPSELLEAALPTADLRRGFLDAYVRHTGSPPAFWHALRARAEYVGKVEELQTTVHLAALTRNHLPLFRELNRMRQAGELAALADLTRFDETGWRELLSRDAPGGRIGAPPDAPGATEAERLTTYAAALARTVEDGFPTRYFARRLADDTGFPGRDDVQAFLGANPDFDLRRHRLDTYLLTHPDALAGLPDVDRAKRQVKAIQRLFKLAPRYRQVRVLLNAGITSAQAAAGMGWNLFQQTMGLEFGPPSEQKMFYSKAQQTSAMALSLLGSYALVGAKVPTKVAPDDAVLEVEGVPEWASMFGSLELCSCEHCRSVLSPAAYLVDLLHFLSQRPSRVIGKKAKDVLFLRRPDLGDIELTCENTNTPLPYVDLALEVLEDAVAPPPPFTPFAFPAADVAAVESALNSRTLTDTLRNAFVPPLSDEALITVGSEGQPWPPDDPWWTIDEPAYTYALRKEDGQLTVEARSRQTKGPAAERATTPQYRTVAAYGVLGHAVFPWSLPFDLPAAEADVYFGHLGVRRADLMEALLPGSRADILTNVALARESLGLGSLEASIIVGQTTSQPDSATPGPWNLWGFVDATLSPASAIPDPSDSLRRIAAGAWIDVLRGRVDVFLQQAGLSYGDLLDLLDTYYVNPAANDQRLITIVSTDEENVDTCETSKLALNGLDAAAAARAVRFVRLWRRLGWSMRDLDRAITAFGGTGPDDALLIRLAHVQRVQAALGLPVQRLLSWWSPIDSARYIDHQAPGQARSPSLYDQLFRNRAIINPPDGAFVEQPGSLGGTLSDHVPTIAAALRLTPDDLKLLLASPQILPPDATDPTTTDDALSLDNLSRLHRHASLARAARLKVRDHLAALAIVAPDPFAPTTDTILFLEKVTAVRESGFTFGELAYLLRHSDAPERPLAPSDEAVGTLLATLRAGLQQIALENTFRPDPDDPAGPTVDLDGGHTRQKLALLNWDRPQVDEAVATVGGTRVDEAPATLPAGLALPNAPQVYAVPLAALPAQFGFPPELGGVVAHDGASQELRASRLLTGPERALLTEAAAATGDVAFPAAVAALVAEQDALAGDITYDAARGVLRFSGAMTNARKARLDATPGGDAAYLAAVQSLYDAPRRFVRRHMHSFTLPDFSTALPALPAAIRIPPLLKKKVYYDEGSDPPRLHSRGALTDQERALLLALVTDPADAGQAAFGAAVQQLHGLPDSFTPAPGEEFLTPTGANNDAAALFDAPLEAGDRFRLVLVKLLPYLRRLLSERLAAQTMAEDLALEPRTGDALLRELAVSPADPSRHCLDELLDPLFAESHALVTPGPKAFPAQFLAYLRLHKAALVVTRFKLSFRQLGWLWSYGNAAGWLDPNELPLAADQSAAPFEGWLRLAELARVRSGLPRGEDTLDRLLAAAHGVDAGAPALELDAAKAGWFDMLRERTRWSADDLTALLGAADDHTQVGTLGVGFPDGYRGVLLLSRLRDAFAALKRLGLAAADAITLVAGDVTGPGARVLRQAIHARYLDETQWQAAVRPLADALREKQRAALVAYLVAHLRLPLTIMEWPHPVLVFNPNQTDPRPAVRELQRKLNAAGAVPPGVTPPLPVSGVFDATTHSAVIVFQQENGLPGTGTVDAATWALLDVVRHGVHDANDLYGYFLIDVEMDPCMLTSRIKQALSSLQLFVQRALMGLEPDVAAGIAVDTHWRHWKWMKNYRVWEANRKIFLYPENWIEPELRDDKSPFFRELESELLQGDLTDELAEQALLHYLGKLDEVARLEVVALHHQVEKDATGNVAVDVLHVFARTPDGSPRTYFYRRRTDGFWTAWERVELDITGEHLLPIVWNRRLYLFWPIFSDEKAEPPAVTIDSASGSLSGGGPTKFREVSIAWSERHEGSWSAKKVSTVAFKVYASDLAVPEDAFFRWKIDADDNLSIGFQHRELSWLFPIGFRFDGCHTEPIRMTNFENHPIDLNPVTEVTATAPDRTYLREVDEAELYLPVPTDTAALATTPGTFRILAHANEASIAKHGTFYQDPWRAYFADPHDIKVPVTLADPDSADVSVIIGSFVWPEIQPFDPAGPVIHLPEPDPALFEASFPGLV